MTSVRSPDAVAAALAQRQLQPGDVILVDGFPTSGKSTLARSLGQRLGANVVHFDDFIDKERLANDYVAKLRIAQLTETLQHRRDRIVVADGVCGRDVLERVGVSATTTVYVKRVSEQGLWHDGIAVEAFEADQAAVPAERWLYRQVLAYHARTRPHEASDIVFERTESVPDEA